MDDVKKIKCDQCGCESEIAEAFCKFKSVLSRKGGMFCPECWSKRHMHKSKLDFYVTGLALVGGLILHHVVPSNFFAVILINMAFIYTFMALSVIPHELGHVIVGRLVGFNVFRVIIGYGNILYSYRLFDQEWEFRTYPLGGLTVGATRLSKFYRLRRFVMVFSGPLVNLFLIVLLVKIIPPFHVLGCVPLNTDLLLANTILLVVNLWPQKLTTAAGIIENDGLTLLTTPFLKRKKIEEHLAIHTFVTAHELSRQKQFGKAVIVCQEGLGLFPDSLPLHMRLGVTLLALKEYEKARNVFSDLLDRKGITPMQQMVLLNNIAYSNILAGRNDLIEESDRYSDKAYKNMPWNPAIKGTRGAVLVEADRIDEGVKLLREAFSASSEPESKALQAAHLAHGEQMRGNHEESRKYLNIAYSLDPQCQLLSHFNNEVCYSK